MPIDLKQAASRLQYFIAESGRDGGLRSLVNQECHLVLCGIIDLLGVDVVRTWADDYVTRLAAGLAKPDGQGCKDCRGLGRHFTRDGLNPQCKACSGTGVI